MNQLSEQPQDYLVSEIYGEDVAKCKKMDSEIRAIEKDENGLAQLRIRKSLIEGSIASMQATLLSTLMDRVFTVVTALMAAWMAVSILGGFNLLAALIMALLLLAYALVEMLWRSHLLKKQLWYQVYLRLLESYLSE